jgi:hypothetical protein
MRILAMIFLALASVAVQAQTLDFYDRVSGSSTSLLSGTIGPLDDLPLATYPTFGTITGSITLNGSAGGTYNFGFNEHGGNGPGIEANVNFSFGGQLYSCGADFYCSYDGNVQILTNGKGAITGATADLSDNNYNGPSGQMTIGPTGVAASFLGTIPGTSGFDCPAAELSNFTGNDGTYTGPTIKDCNVNVSGNAGHWSVPEMDPTSAVASLMLLLGGVLVSRGRRAIDAQSAPKR